MMTRVMAGARWVWWWWRQVSGDAAYENYVRRGEVGRRGANHEGHGAECVHGEGALTREEYYLAGIERRYRGVSRCC